MGKDTKETMGRKGTSCLWMSIETRNLTCGTVELVVMCSLEGGLLV